MKLHIKSKLMSIHDKMQILDEQDKIAAMEIVMDYAVEIPIYQRSECYLLSSERVVADSLPTDMTPYWSYKSEIEGVAVK